jgi:hypothetical protein
MEFKTIKSTEAESRLMVTEVRSKGLREGQRTENLRQEGYFFEFYCTAW